MTTPAPMYKLVNRDLLRQLMQRTGSGHRLTVRALAEAVSVSHGTVGNLLTGYSETVPCETAHAIADAIGVDVLILFTPVGRSVPTPQAPEAVTA